MIDRFIRNWAWLVVNRHLFLLGAQHRVKAATDRIVSGDNSLIGHHPDVLGEEPIGH